MSEEEKDLKDFEPTQKKLEDARRKGDIVKSTDVGSLSIYCGMYVAILYFSSGFAQELGSAFVATISASASYLDLDVFYSSSLTLATVQSVWPLFVLPFLLAVIAFLVQRAFVFAPSKLEPKLNRISILKNFKQKFGLSGLFEFAKSSLKMFAVCICLTVFTIYNIEPIIFSALLKSSVSLSLWYDLGLRFLTVLIAVLFVFAAIDYGFQYFDYMRRNRMTQKEVRDETKDAEGDPYMKNERQARARQISSQQMLSDVAGADVLVVNPTHYAVALAWERTPGSAPKCVAKGVDELALSMREIAGDANVPIHRDAPTARSLYASTEVGSEIDPEFYQAVAEAIRFADELRAKAGQRSWK